MAELYLPVLSHFQNQNTWIASDKRLRFKVTPGEEGLSAEIWEGPWAYDLSRVEETCVFPMEDEGIDALRLWLLEKAAEVNKRPKRTLADELARREQKEA